MLNVLPCGSVWLPLTWHVTLPVWFGRDDVSVNDCDGPWTGVKVNVVSNAVGWKTSFVPST